ALGILAASNHLAKEPLSYYEFAGELALSGELRPVNGILPAALTARDAGRSLILPEQNVAEAALVSGLDCYPANHILEVCSHLNSINALPLYKNNLIPADDRINYLDMADVYGQNQARRALEISAAGGHSPLMLCPINFIIDLLSEKIPTVIRNILPRAMSML
ncbi:MAG: ATP-binding protein, partial [Candidatus Thiodiazotropha sp. (ex Lucinoma annulata)]|nr:ATP-binding protein [Candidatus Thiodiazotropha sp. (ex Lucinoma annulata)]